MHAPGSRSPHHPLKYTLQLVNYQYSQCVIVYILGSQKFNVFFWLKNWINYKASSFLKLCVMIGCWVLSWALMFISVTLMFQGHRNGWRLKLLVVSHQWFKNIWMQVICHFWTLILLKLFTCCVTVVWVLFVNVDVYVCGC